MSVISIPISSPIRSPIGNVTGGNGGTNADVKFEVTRVALSGSTGTQDITISGFGTPKAAIIAISHCYASNELRDELLGSIGATDGTSQWCCSAHEKNSASSWYGQRYTTDTKLAVVESPGATTLIVEIAFDSWITDGIRVNTVTNSGSSPYYITVTLIGGSDVSAKVGTGSLATQNNAATITPGLKANALWTLSTVQTFDETFATTPIMATGLASWDGSTARQVGHLYRSDGATKDVRGEIRTAAMMPVTSDRYVELGNITTTQFDLTSRGGDLSSYGFGYLALELTGGAEAWAGVLDTPTSTGNHDFAGPTFTPSFAVAIPSMMSSVNATDGTGEGGGWGYSFITASAEFNYAWSDEDASLTSNSQTSNTAKSFDLYDDAGVSAFVGTLSSFSSGTMTTNFTTVDGTARKWPMMLIGS